MTLPLRSELIGCAAALAAFLCRLRLLLRLGVWSPALSDGGSLPLPSRGVFEGGSANSGTGSCNGIGATVGVGNGGVCVIGCLTGIEGSDEGKFDGVKGFDIDGGDEGIASTGCILGAISGIGCASDIVGEVISGAGDIGETFETRNSSSSLIKASNVKSDLLIEKSSVK